MPSSSNRIERARPLLGTTVAIRVHGLEERAGHRAIDDAFAEIALIHRLMSFQEPQSDISRLNREALNRPQPVHPATFAVLSLARKISEASDGCFDITVAPKLVAWGLLPAPASRHAPDEEANWRDVALEDDGTVRFRRPLWIDVSGIAKGYAVDLAVETLRSHGAVQACVNAGGDLRVYGPDAERVGLRLEEPDPQGMAVIEIENAAVASSSGHFERRLRNGEYRGPHVDGHSGRPVPTDRFASVVAASCAVADALTKPVLVLEESSEPLLRRFGASAHVFDPAKGWRHLARLE